MYPGGYWIGVVTPGRAIVPPLLYGLGPSDGARAISEELARWQTDEADPSALVRRMRTEQVDWLFLGERSAIDPAPLASIPTLTPIYTDGPIRLYHLQPEPG